MKDVIAKLRCSPFIYTLTNVSESNVDERILLLVSRLTEFHMRGAREFRLTAEVIPAT